EDVDQNAATAMGPSVVGDDEGFGEEPASGETPSAWDVEEPAPAQAARSAAAPMLAAGAAPEWGGLWVGLLGVATFLMLLLAFVGMDVVRNLHDFKGEVPVASGLVRQIAGMVGGG